MVKLTEKQEQVYRMILDFIDARGYPPTVREIQSHFQWSSANTVTNYLTALGTKGWIENGGGARAIRIVHDRVRVDRLTDPARSSVKVSNFTVVHDDTFPQGDAHNHPEG